MEVIATSNNQNLRPFNTLPPVERRELARRGGIASGERRRYLADMKLACLEHIAGFDLTKEVRKEYRQAIKRYVKEERKKARNRRRNDTMPLYGEFDMELFRDRLRMCRKREKISCSVLSGLCGLSTGTVARYENGERIPSIETAAQLANVLDVSLDWLCGRV